MADNHVLVCNTCQNTNVRVEYWASMNPDTGKMELGDSQETAWCLDCEDYIGIDYSVSH
jgi:hypothetical protein